MKISLKKRWLVSLAFLAIASFYVWLVSLAMSPTLPSPETPIVFYSSQCRQDLQQLFYKALEKAQSSIICHMYAITDPRILHLLKCKAQEGLEIKIFYDASASLNLEEEFKGMFCTFPVHSQGLMHRKIVIIDGKDVYLGTANFTTQSLHMHDNLVLGIYHEELASYLSSCLTSHLTFSISGKESEIWLLPDHDSLALKQVEKYIQEAHKSIYIAMFTFTHPLLAQRLIEAKGRGVDVRIAIDFYTAQGASHKTLEYLKAYGIPIYLSRGRQLLHHKWAYIDGTSLILGSANWTTAAFTKNQDCLMRLSDLTRDQKKFMDRLWDILVLESQ